MAREYEDPVISTMKKAGAVPEYQQMMDYLMSRRAIPEMRTRWLGEAMGGMFQYNGDIPSRGRITTNEGAGVNTLVHEVTHATERQMANQYFEDTRSKNILFQPGSTQFSEAFNKIRFAPEKEVMANVMAPEWSKKYKDYRSTFGEATAFGVANSVAPKTDDFRQLAPAHVDATMATEFLILLDLAKRGMKDRPQSQGR